MFQTVKDRPHETRVTLLRIGLGLVAAASAIVAALLAEPVLRFAAGEIDVRGVRRYDPPHPTDAAALASLDLGRVHRELIPAWVIARAESRSSDRAGEALRAAVSGDANLTALVAEMDRLVLDGPANNADRLLYLSWSWNRYLDANGHPWRVDATVRLDTKRGTFAVTCYEVLATVPISVGGTPFRALLMNRTDKLNLVESYLGQASSDAEGAEVVVDRVADFALARVWPLLDPALDEVHTRLGRTFAPAVRAEVKAAMDPAAFDLLRRTARDRAAMAAAVDGVHERHACGSQFMIAGLPWNGVSAIEHEQLLTFAERSRRDACPAVTLAEANAVGAASRRLQSTDGLEDAVEALVAWVARSVAVHEARHTADLAAVGDGALPCPACPEETDSRVRAELSAYLASFAAGPTSAVALYQACDVIAGDPGGTHAAALALVLHDLLPAGCEAEPPANLSAAARAAEVRWLGRSESITLPAEFPRRLDLR